MIVDAHAEDIVKSIFEYKIRGYNEAKIAGILTANGVLPPFAYKKLRGIPYNTPFAKGCCIAWSPNSVRRILQNRVYLGHLEQGKRTKANYRSKKLYDKPCDAWSICLKTHEPIIDELDFDIVQELMAMNTRTPAKSEQLHLFSGFLICGLCGQPMTVKTVKKRWVKPIAITFAPHIRKPAIAKTIILATWYLRELFCLRSGSRLQICFQTIQ